MGNLATMGQLFENAGYIGRTLQLDQALKYKK
jgi:hypothetical protein